MKTTLYRIPNEFFPGVKVIQPFHAKVNYKVTDGKVSIDDFAISANCMDHIGNLRGLRMRMQEDIQAAETGVGSVHPLIQQALKPATIHLQD